jgi:hypothetical protein
MFGVAVRPPYEASAIAIAITAAVSHRGLAPGGEVSGWRLFLPEDLEPGGYFTGADQENRTSVLRLIL